MLIPCSVLLRWGVQNTGRASEEESKPLRRKNTEAQPQARLLIREVADLSRSLEDSALFSWLYHTG